MDAPKQDCPDRKIYKLPDIIRIYSVSRSSIYRAMENDGFPKPINLTGRSVGWWASSVDEYFINRPSAITPCADHAQYQTERYLTSRPVPAVENSRGK